MLRTIIIVIAGLMLFTQNCIGEETQVVTSFSKQTDVRQASDVTAEELNEHLQGVLAGKGDVFLQAEREHGVNAVFLASIAIVESANGKSKMARSRNNVFGMKGKRFENVDACIMQAGNLIANSPYYFKRGKHTINAIQKVYAPNYDAKTNCTWSSQVVTYANKIQN